MFSILCSQFKHLKFGQGSFLLGDGEAPYSDQATSCTTEESAVGSLEGQRLSPPQCPSRLWDLLCGPGVGKRPVREADDDLPQLPRLVMRRALP